MLTTDTVHLRKRWTSTIGASPWSRFAAALVAASITILLAACSPDGGPTPDVDRPDATPSAGGSVTIGVLADVENWNPYLTDSAFAEDTLSFLYPTLAIEQADFVDHPPTFTPNLAESWQVSDDGLEITFQLRTDARWGDGTRVTADDVLFTWKTQTDPTIAWIGAEIKSAIDSVEALDESTVRFRFTHVYPYQMMDVNDGLIIPAAWSAIPFADWETTDWKAAATSAGPFRLAEATPQQEIVFARNPTYWVADRPYLERVIWRVVPDQTALLTQLLAGELDMMQQIPPHEVERVRSRPNIRLAEYPDRTYSFVGWNLRNDLFSDPQVRRALTMAIDRQGIVRGVLHGHGEVAAGPVLSTMWAFNDALEAYPYAPQQATELLAAAGWRDSDGDGTLDRDQQPFAFELITNAGNQIREDVCVRIANDLERIGISATPRFLEWGAMLGALDGAEFDAFVFAFRESTQVDLYDLWHSANPDEPTYNWVGFADEDVDRLLEEVDVAVTTAQQGPPLARIQEIIHSQQPVTFLYEGHRVDAINTRIRDADVNAATPYFNLDAWHVRARTANGS